MENRGKTSGNGFVGSLRGVGRQAADRRWFRTGATGVVFGVRDRLDPAKMSVIVAGDAKAFADALKTRAPNLEVIPAAELDLDRPDLRKAR